MRLSHYLLIIATIAWMAVAMVWGVNTFVIDVSAFGPIEVVFLAAFAVSALIAAVIFDEAAQLAAQAEFGGFSLPSPRSLMQNMRYRRHQRRLRRERRALQREMNRKRSDLRRW